MSAIRTARALAHPVAAAKVLTENIKQAVAEIKQEAKSQARLYFQLMNVNEHLSPSQRDKVAKRRAPRPTNVVVKMRSGHLRYVYFTDGSLRRVRT